jgi:hypothetical protein
MTWGDPNEAVRKWQAEADRLEDERAAAKADMKREQERHERSAARASAREEIAALEQRLAAVEQQLANFDQLAQAVATFGDAVDGKLAELQQLLSRHAELRQAEPSPSKGFQFAREKSTEVLDLPNFIRKMN